MIPPLQLAGLVFVIFAGYLIINPEQRRIFFQKIRLELRQLIPNPVSREKDVLKKQPEAPTYTDTYPPSGREALVAIYDQLPESFKKESPRDLEKPRKGPDLRNDKHLSELKGNEVSPTGFTVDEIQRLGNFPDYASLSGVPLPPEYTQFDIETAQPRPTRPFRWAYHQTMSLTKLEHDWWLELFAPYKDVIAERKEIFKHNADQVLQTLPGSELAVNELMEMCLQFLVARYPHYFTLDKEKMLFHNKILNITTDIRERAAEHPFHVIFDHIPEDFGVMIRNPDDGLYYLRAGCVCSALGWDVKRKIGKPLALVHEPVPDYKEKMKFSMDRFFAKMPTDKGIERGSWGLEIDKPLFMPPGDPHEKYREYQPAELTLDRINLRIDWQTLRRLPLSGAIIFNFKCVFTPMTEFRDEPYIPKLVLKILDEGKANIMAYKNCWHVEHVARPELQKWVDEQERDGVVEKGWEPKTLDQHPMWPGWEKKWERQQGFKPPRLDAAFTTKV